MPKKYSASHAHCIGQFEQDNKGKKSSKDANLHTHDPVDLQTQRPKDPKTHKTMNP